MQQQSPGGGVKRREQRRDRWGGYRLEKEGEGSCEFFWYWFWRSNYYNIIQEGRERERW